MPNDDSDHRDNTHSAPGDSELPTSPAVSSDTVTAPAVSTAIPQRIGHYHIVRKIGEGGMGAVYEAEQDHPKRTVALKVINLGVASQRLLRRFEHEADVLGKLQHSCIAQIYEAGTFDTGSGAQPFFAMEYVKGEPLTRYADRHRLTTRQRLGVVVKVCDAVQHAHQRGVIHRDLKPGNILVDQTGQPKVLDFGVARATDSDVQKTTMHTEIGQLIGTVPYMSPEQAAGDPDEVDTRSDVYALGVAAYELLCGRLPHLVEGKMIHEAVRVIREETPARPSTIKRTLRGDVETIALKALEKDRDRRYQSASALAEDIRRYLRDEPIVARPPSVRYQFGKFAKRNKAAVVGAAAVFVALVAGTVVSIGFGLSEGEQRRMATDNLALAQQRADELETVIKFQQSMLSEIDAELMEVRGVNRTNLALKLEQLAGEAVVAARETLGAEHWYHGVFLGNQGRALAALERSDDGESALLEAHGILQTAVGDEHVQTRKVVGYLADLYDAWGKPQKAAEWRAKLPTEQEAVASDKAGQSSSDDKQ